MIEPVVIPVGTAANAVMQVTNTSVISGTATPAAYIFTVAISVTVAGTVILSDARQLSLAAGETASISWPFTPSLSGAGEATASLLTTDGVTVLATATPASFTVEAAVVNVRFHVDLQGRPAPPHPSWVTLLSVVFFEHGTNTVIEEELNITTDNAGYFSIGGVPTGVCDIGVKAPRTLSNLVTATIYPTTALVNLGTLREGDANNDDAVTGADSSILYYYYGATSGAGLEACDFNRDGVVNSADYSLLYANYGQVGDMYGKWP